MVSCLDLLWLDDWLVFYQYTTAELGTRTGQSDGLQCHRFHVDDADSLSGVSPGSTMTSKRAR